MKKIIRRVLTILPAILLQLLWIFLLAHWLAPWAGLITFALSIFALLAVLFIITKRDEGTYKILWLLVILTFPLAGALLYLIVGNRRSTKPLQKRLAAVEAWRTPAWRRPSAISTTSPAAPSTATAMPGTIPWATCSSPSCWRR